MYSDLPTLERRVVKISIISGWAGLAWSGVGGAVFPGRSVITAVGPEWLSVATSAIYATASLVAILGVILTRRVWWLEWTASGLAGFGLVYYAAVPWGYLLSGETGRMQQSGAVITALMWTVYRMVTSWVYSRKLARAHALSVSTDRIPNVG